MSSDQWDSVINEELLTPEERHQRTMDEWVRARDARLERRQSTLIEFPVLSEEQIRNDFSYYNDREQAIGHYWGPNRVFIVCLDCGFIGYKMSSTHINELTKCSVWRCKSRNIRVVRAGDIANVLRNTSVGLDMNAVYNARKERLRAARRARRQNAASRANSE